MSLQILTPSHLIALPQGSDGSLHGAEMLLLPALQPSGARWRQVLAQYRAIITRSLPEVAIRLNVSETPEGTAKKAARYQAISLWPGLICARREIKQPSLRSLVR